MIKHEVLDFSGTEPTMDDLEYIADTWAKDLVVLDNHTVFALACNANNSNVQQRIVDVKGGQRGVLQPVGWTRPFDERSLPTIDVSRIESHPLREFLQDPESLTKALGGLAFIRATADMAAKERLQIPDCIIAPLTKAELADGKTTTVQIYSPEGIRYTEELVHIAISAGAEPVMTSANRSTKPESVTKTDALNFLDSIEADNQPPALSVVWKDDATKASGPRGSYSILEVKDGYFELVRAGCFCRCVLQAMVPEYPIVTSPNLTPAKYFSSTLHMHDLEKDIRWLQGPELRIGLLATYGWSSESVSRT